MSVLSTLKDKLTSDYRTLGKAYAYEVEDEAGNVSRIAIYEVAVEAHKETDEMRYRKRSKVNTQCMSGFTKPRRLHADERGMFHQRNITLYRYDYLPRVYGPESAR